MLLLPTAKRERRLDCPASDSPAALIKEARRRKRRRRLRLAAGGPVLLAGIAAAVYALAASGGPDVIAGTATSPYAGARAFSGHGELAFVSRGQLWVLDGAGGRLRHLQVPVGYTADSPSFSHDGHWLAYAVESTNTNYDGTYQLWLARGDGTGAHRIAGVRLDDVVGWSPRSDLLAVTAGRQLKHPPVGDPTEIDLVSPDERVRILLRAPAAPRAAGDGVDAVDGAAWSPTGRALAVDLQGELRSKIESVPLRAPGRPTVWFAARNGPVRITGLRGRVPAELEPELAGWWSRWGIAFWVIDFGQSRNLDNTPLAVISEPGERPRYLAQTLSVGITDGVAPGPGGKLALVASSASGDRNVQAGKTVQSCTAGTAACRSVPAATIWRGTRLPVPRIPDCRNCARLFPGPANGRPGSAVSEDPSWSPGGRLLAYVKAPVSKLPAWPTNPWFADHAVYVWNPVSGVTRRVGRVNGSALPTWSGNGRDLMYESGDALWLMPLGTGRPVEIVHPLYPETEWNNKTSHLGAISFYGQIPWHDQFSWWSP